jgi:hypothetical protein
MPVIDFKEIPEATGGSSRDRFELFARELLHLRGFKIVEEPDRGPDGGRDLVVEERRTGVGGETRVRWLVSCKHKAHSGSSVTPKDEPDIGDRLTAHKCNGFFGVYSTVISSGLSDKLYAPGVSYEVLVYDPEKIERYLLSNNAGLKLASRFFPISIQRLQKENPKPADVFSDNSELLCKNCNRSLMDVDAMGIVVSWTRYLDEEFDDSRKKIVYMYWCCKGKCDEVMAARVRKQTPEMLLDTWEDIPDLKIPFLFIRWVMAVFNELRSGVTYSDSAFNANRELLIALYPHVCRHMTSEERERLPRVAHLVHYF